MSAANFKPSLTLVLSHEGGYVNHPKDPGGATDKGITQRVYDAYRRLNGLKVQSVAKITLGEAAAIYKQQYWNAILADRLPVGVDYAAFDFAVNSGVGRAVRYLQLCVGVAVDGHLGNVTILAINEASPQELILNLCSRRMGFLKSLDTYATFGRGWRRRVIGNQDGAQHDDIGVIDYAMNMAGANMILPKPKAIGALIGEPQTAKAVNDDAFMPGAPLSYGELKAGRWAA